MQDPDEVRQEDSNKISMLFTSQNICDFSILSKKVRVYKSGFNEASEGRWNDGISLKTGELMTQPLHD